MGIGDTRKNGNHSGRRLTRRVLLRIAFHITGHDSSGVPFQTTADSINLSSRGGCLILDKDLDRGQHFTLTGPKGTRFLGRVCWSHYAHNANVRIVGFSLDELLRGWVLYDRQTYQLRKPPVR